MTFIPLPVHASASTPINWGIIGTGYIAHRFASDLACVPDARLVAIGSRSTEKVRAFGKRFDIPRRYGNYAELANDPSVQAIYIATPASAHIDNMLLCLNAGKAVVATRIRLATTQQLVAVAKMSDGSYWTHTVDVIVTLAACIE
jgi:predicted homoserine dehydrogenase-like protein